MNAVYYATLCFDLPVIGNNLDLQQFNMSKKFKIIKQRIRMILGD